MAYAAFARAPCPARRMARDARILRPLCEIHSAQFCLTSLHRLAIRFALG